MSIQYPVGPVVCKHSIEKYIENQKDHIHENISENTGDKKKQNEKQRKIMKYTRCIYVRMHMSVH